MAQPRDVWLGSAFLIVQSYEGNPKLFLPAIDQAAWDFWKTFFTLRLQPEIRYNLTRDQFKKELRAFIQDVARNDSAKYVVIFFIGHGGHGDTLILQDGNSSVTVEEIDDIFTDLPSSKYSILVIDACRDLGGYYPKHPNTILARSTLPHQKAWGASGYGTRVFGRLYLYAFYPPNLCFPRKYMHGAYSRAVYTRGTLHIYSIKVYSHGLY